MAQRLRTLYPFERLNRCIMYYSDYVLSSGSRTQLGLFSANAVDAFLHRFDLRVYHLHACDPLIREETGTPPAAVEWS
jgi:hypothetical protein